MTFPTQRNVDGAWEFAHSGDAYDATQCCDWITRGDLIVIKSERVVGIADTWPIAVTPEHGELHTKKESWSWCDVSAHIGIGLHKIHIAIDYARKLGFMKEL